MSPPDYFLLKLILSLFPGPPNVALGEVMSKRRYFTSTSIFLLLVHLSNGLDVFCGDMEIYEQQRFGKDSLALTSQQTTDMKQCLELCCGIPSEFTIVFSDMEPSVPVFSKISPFPWLPNNIFRFSVFPLIEARQNAEKSGKNNSIGKKLGENNPHLLEASDFGVNISAYLEFSSRISLKCCFLKDTWLIFDAQWVFAPLAHYRSPAATTFVPVD